MQLSLDFLAEVKNQNLPIKNSRKEFSQRVRIFFDNTRYLRGMGNIKFRDQMVKELAGPILFEVIEEYGGVENVFRHLRSINREFIIRNIINSCLLLISLKNEQFGIELKQCDLPAKYSKIVTMTKTKGLVVA